MAWNDFLKGYSNTQRSNIAGGIGSLGMGLGSWLSNWQNPAQSAIPELNKIPGMMQPYYEPYSQAGQRVIPQLETQYSALTGDPGAMLNKIGAGYQQSPGFQFALQQALAGANRGAAAGGMAGSPMSQQQNMELATQLANQDYYNWLGQAGNLYGRGLTGQENLMQTGYGAGNEFALTMGNLGLQKALMQYLGQAAQNQSEQGGLGRMLGGVGSIVGGLLF